MLSMLKYPPAHTLLLEDVLLHPQDKGNEREEETDIRCREQFTRLLHSKLESREGRSFLKYTSLFLCQSLESVAAMTKKYNQNNSQNGMKVVSWSIILREVTEVHHLPLD